MDELVLGVQGGDIVAAADALAADEHVGHRPPAGPMRQLLLQGRPQRVHVQLDDEGGRYNLISVQQDLLGLGREGAVRLREDDDCTHPSSVGPGRPPIAATPTG